MPRLARLLQGDDRGFGVGVDFDFILAGKPAEGEEHQVSRGVDRLLQCGERDAAVAGREGAPNFAGGVADLFHRNRTGRGGRGGLLRGSLGGFRLFGGVAEQ